jgi:UDP-N-acetylmuramoyl-L-alanyl-D-glutamate--2,6-diaminopimelate ligase
VTPVAVGVIRDALAAAGLIAKERGAAPAAVSGISDDSRGVRAGGLFVAVRGVAADGHDYLGAAVRAGAALAIVEDEQKGAASGVPFWVVLDARRAAAVAAAAFYGKPAEQLALIGVTGTNGKTTTVGMLRHLLDEAGAPSASIGTLGVLVGSSGASLPGGHDLTTPGPVELQQLLRALVDRGVRTVTMEASSHALHQHRIEGIRFAAAVFTNLTRDHLDYHGTMEAYFAAKASLVDHLEPDGIVVRNADDPTWDGLMGARSAGRRFISFGVRSPADVTATGIRFTPRGSSWVLTTAGESHRVQLPLIGDFNVDNALGAAAAAYAMKVPLETIARRLSAMPQVPGRLEIIAEHPTVLRDYAHTPDALERALTALRPFTAGALIVVFGAGGDRDKGKRPLMGLVADRLADKIVVTSDNPRTEDPERIIDDVVGPLAATRYERFEDRRAAIARAIALADPARDVVLLAGKGHETYQVRGTEKLPFDESTIVRELLSARVGAGAGS